MAITARTILTQPAATAVAAVTLLGLTAFGTGAFSSLQSERVASADPCERPIVEQNEAFWSEADWISYVSCYESRNDVRGTVQAATTALQYKPKSEILWNAKSIGEILLDDHAAAEKSLRTALQRVEPTTGTMENNLAWVGMWTDMNPNEARDLYTVALEKSPVSCEIIHTGLFVEYQLAQADNRHERFWALKKYKNLRQRYANQRCESRISSGDWTRLAEVGGLAMLDEEVEKLMGRADARANPVLFATVKQLRAEHLGASVDAFCAEALPPSHSSVDCVSYFQDTRDEVVGFDVRTKPSTKVINVKKKEGCRFAN